MCLPKSTGVLLLENRCGALMGDSFLVKSFLKSFPPLVDQWLEA